MNQNTSLDPSSDGNISETQMETGMNLIGDETSPGKPRFGIRPDDISSQLSPSSLPGLPSRTAYELPTHAFSSLRLTANADRRPSEKRIVFIHASEKAEFASPSKLRQKKVALLIISGIGGQGLRKRILFSNSRTGGAVAPMRGL